MTGMLHKYASPFMKHQDINAYLMLSVSLPCGGDNDPIPLS